MSNAKSSFLYLWIKKEICFDRIQKKLLSGFILFSIIKMLIPTFIILSIYWTTLATFRLIFHLNLVFPFATLPTGEICKLGICFTERIFIVLVLNHSWNPFSLLYIFCHLITPWMHKRNPQITVIWSTPLQMCVHSSAHTWAVEMYQFHFAEKTLAGIS